MKHPHLPEPKRVDDPKDLKGWDATRFRLAIMARRYPIQIAMVIMLVIVAYPVWLLVSSSQRLENAQRDTQHAQQELQDAVTSTTASRKASSAAYCEAIVQNTTSLNSVTDFLAATVRQSAGAQKQNSEQRKATNDFVAGLVALKSLPLDCGNFQRQIERDIARIRKADGHP